MEVRGLGPRVIWSFEGLDKKCQNSTVKFSSLGFQSNGLRLDFMVGSTF